MSEKASHTPLEDLMVAMDVVDTLRHSEKLVARELDSEGRRKRLIARLRDIYAAQGIEVTDAMLEEGVRALEEDRFGYSPPKKSFSTFLAYLYVKRSRWGKPLFLLLIIGLVALSIYYFGMVRPESAREQQLPLQVQQTYSELATISKDNEASKQAQTLLDAAKTALENGRREEAVGLHRQLNSMLTELKRSYQLKVVTGPNKRSGVWRIPDINSQARNYYLIVEAVTSDGNRLTLPILSEESGKIKKVSSWGLRVDQNVFNLVAADKRDDGIIQKNIVGTKERGFLKPQYSIGTTGATITEW